MLGLFGSGNETNTDPHGSTQLHNQASFCQVIIPNFIDSRAEYSCYYFQIPKLAVLLHILETFNFMYYLEKTKQHVVWNVVVPEDSPTPQQPLRGRRKQCQYQWEVYCTEVRPIEWYLVKLRTIWLQVVRHAVQSPLYRKSICSCINNYLQRHAYVTRNISGDYAA